MKRFLVWRVLAVILVVVGLWYWLSPTQGVLRRQRELLGYLNFGLIPVMSPEEAGEGFAALLAEEMTVRGAQPLPVGRLSRADALQRYLHFRAVAQRCRMEAGEVVVTFPARGVAEVSTDLEMEMVLRGGLSREEVQPVIFQWGKEGGAGWRLRELRFENPLEGLHHFEDF